VPVGGGIVSGVCVRAGRAKEWKDKSAPKC